MSSLMHTIYDVVDASVNHSCHNKSKTLRVKLTVTPEPRCHRRETGTGKTASYLRHYLLSNYALSQHTIPCTYVDLGNSFGSDTQIRSLVNCQFSSISVVV